MQKPILSNTQSAYLQLHIAVFLFGFTAILGKLISIAELPLVWWRLLLTCISLLFVPKIFNTLRQIPRVYLWQMIGIGIIVSLHWVFFYGAINYSNASITLVCMATTSFMTSILEPLILRQRFKFYELILGLIIIPAMYMIVLSVDIAMATGIWMGLLSAFLAALFSILNKRVVPHVPPMSMTFVELGSGLIFLSIVIPIYFQVAGQTAFIPTWTDMQYLLVLSLLCTTLAYVLSLNALKYISAFSNALTVNLEPVYGIILAYFLLNESEQLNPNFYYGSVLILLAVFIHPLLNRLRKKQTSA